MVFISLCICLIVFSNQYIGALQLKKGDYECAVFANDLEPGAGGDWGLRALEVTLLRLYSATFHFAHRDDNFIYTAIV